MWHYAMHGQQAFMIGIYSSRPLISFCRLFYTKAPTFEKIIKDQKKQGGSSTSGIIARIWIPLISQEIWPNEPDFYCTES